MLYLKITWNQFNFFPQYPILFIFFLHLFIPSFCFLTFFSSFSFSSPFNLTLFFLIFFSLFNASLITSPPSNCPPFLLPGVSLTLWVWSGDVGMQDGDCGLGIWGCGCGAGVWWLWYFLACGWVFYGCVFYF